MAKTYLIQFSFRKNAEGWAQREGLGQEQMKELGELMMMSFHRYIPKSMLTNWMQIDNGSFGKIYRCIYSGTEVAVKEIGQKDSQCVLKTRMRELFLELRVLVSLVDHPHIVKFLGTAMDFPRTGSQNPSVDMVFAMCHGGSVHRAIFGDDKDPTNGAAAKLRLTPEEKIRIGANVASGLAYLHSQHILHRYVGRQRLTSGKQTLTFHLNIILKGRSLLFFDTKSPV